MLIAEGAQAPQELERGRRVAALALDRLDEDRPRPPTAGSSSTSGCGGRTSPRRSRPPHRRRTHGRPPGTARGGRPGGAAHSRPIVDAELVTDIAPKVRPWNPPRNAMMPGRPVTRRASLSAASIASEPEFRNMTESSGVRKRRGQHRRQPRDRLREAHRVDRADQLDRPGRGSRRSPPGGRGRAPSPRCRWRSRGTPARRCRTGDGPAVAPAPLEVAAEDGRQIRRAAGSSRSRRAIGRV